MEMASLLIMLPGSTNGLQRGKREEPGWKIFNLVCLVWAISNMNILIRLLWWSMNCFMSKAPSTLSKWGWEMMIRVLRMTSLHGGSFFGRSWISYFRMKMRQVHLLLIQLPFLNTGLYLSSLKKFHIWKKF
ncbi:uncharacterized protein LOC122017782 [Zingiber officinale]|uniref:uncharacterized protein LOC122017782 n=1 Tax=Zingiber officinale TaxID=94328 RepID=UPI001C4AEF53|nr:uncharacterized protein LOC122017782 [Zingiber officinale]